MPSYEIIVSNQTNEDESSPIAGSATDGSAEPKQTNKEPEEPSTAKKIAKGYGIAKHFAMPFINSIISHQISTVELRTGNADRQRRSQAIYSIAKRGAGFVESIAIGGMVGQLPGAVMGAVTSIATTAINVAQQYDTYYLRQNIENTSIGLMNVRAGGNVATTNGRR